MGAVVAVWDRAKRDYPRSRVHPELGWDSEVSLVVGIGKGGALQSRLSAVTYC